MRRLIPSLLSGAALVLLAMSPVRAACPQDLAVYAMDDGELLIEFVSAEPSGARGWSNFRMIVGPAIMNGTAEWNAETGRSFGFADHDCPENPSPQQMDDCTVWRGAIYAILPGGIVDALPRSGEDAAERLILVDLANQLRASQYGQSAKLDLLPSDAVGLSGCQE